MRRAEPTRRRSASLLALLALATLLTGPTALPRVDASELTDAQGRRRAVQRAITTERREVHRLRETERELSLALDRSGRELAGIHADLQQVRAGLQQAARALARLEQQHARLRGDVVRLDRELEGLADESRTVERALGERQRLLGSRLSEAYKLGRVSLLEQLLTADSFTAALVDIDAHLEVGEQDAELAAAIAADRRALAALTRAAERLRRESDRARLDVHEQARLLAAERARLARSRTRLAAVEAETRRLVRRQQHAYAAASTDRAAAERRLREQRAADDRLAREIARLAAEEERRREEQARRRAEEERERRLERQRRLREAEEAREAAERRREAREERERERAAEERRRRREERERTRDDDPGPARAGARLRWPMRGRITQEYGCTGFAWEGRRGACAHFHDGIDIVAAYGTPVRAAADGTILFVGYNPYDPAGDRAWIVTISHGRGLVTWYAHLKATRPAGIRRGARVDAGDVIGYEGNTGRSTGAHLHFAVQLRGRFVDPRDFL